MTASRRRFKGSILFSPTSAKAREDDRSLEADRKRLLEHWGKHPWNWLTGKDLDGRPLIWTKDEKDEKAPLKPFPGHLEYLRVLVEILFSPDQQVMLPDGTWLDLERFTAIDKARQMYVSTVIMALMDWWCRFRPYRRFLVSKVKEEDAIELINDKIRQIELGLPDWVRRAVPQDATPAHKINYPKNEAGGGGSYVLGVAQNVARSSARGGTATAILIDEGAFQEETDEIIDGARPMASRIWLVSSPFLGTRGGVTMRKILVSGLEEAEDGAEPGVEVLPGLRVRNTPPESDQPGWTIVTLDYWADPSHDDAWRLQAEKGYTDKRKFRREILRDWGSAAGLPFYPEWTDTGGKRMHVLRIPGLIPGAPIVRGWDFGIRNPACMWLQYDPSKRRVIYLRELSLQGIGTHAFADLVAYFSGQLGEDQLTPYVRQWARNLQSNPRYATPFFTPVPGSPLQFLDWSGHEATQPRAEVADETPEKTSADILASKGIYLNIQYGAVRSGHEILRELLRVRDDGWPGALVDPHCKLWIEALDGALTFKKGTAENPFVEEVKKDGIYSHVHEAALYPLPSLVDLAEAGQRRVAQTLSSIDGALLPARPEADEAYASIMGQ